MICSKPDTLPRLSTRLLIVIGILLLNPAGTAMAQQNSELEMSNISGDRTKPRRHTRIKNPEQMAGSEAEQVYGLIADALFNGYSASGLVDLEGYQSLPRFNNAPYLSASHGNYYLNNYANQKGQEYGLFENAKLFVEGSRLYKDSFSVAANRSIILGPLFIMEKMAPGFNPVSGDWKYIEVLATGDILGETNGPNSDKVTYCISCHLAREQFQHLFFLPEANRKHPTQ